MTRKRKAPAIIVEDGTTDAHRWSEAGRRLRQLAPTTFVQLLALAEGYVSNYERELEPIEAFRTRMAVASVKRGAS